ncbi:MAG: response regulator [Nitrospirota bacterium]|nr:response regulator [Nitrospirota bacterium]
MINDGCRLMVVDDELIVCKRLKQILEKAGYDVTVFNNGEDAVKELELESYDIIVTDLKMEGVDGMKILEAAKRKNPDTRVIMITGFAEIETAREAFRKGVFDFISKPVEIDTIKKVIIKAQKEISGSKT